MKKNIIILHTDQQRYDSLGCTGNENAKTGNIDEIADDGCVFTRHISANPTCSPSRATLLTGLCVPGHGLTSNGIPLYRREVSETDKCDEISMKFFNKKVFNKVPTLADILAKNDYSTALFGKLHLQPHLSDASHGFYESNDSWNNPNIENCDKEYYGFQTHKIILGHGEALCGYNRGHYGRWLINNHPEIAQLAKIGEDANTSVKGKNRDLYLSEIPSEYHNSMWLADEACSYIGAHKNDDKPIFMFVGFPDPHHPFTPPEDISGEFMDMPLPDFAAASDAVGDKPDAVKRAMNMHCREKETINQAYRNTMASIFLIDKAVGKITKYLKENDLYDSSIIIFTSDHGDYMGDLDMLTKSDLPFHNLLHVPFILKGTKDDSLPDKMELPMSNADVVPTLLNMIGIDKDDYIQGVDIFDKNSKNNMPMVTCSGVTGDERNISIYDDTYRYTYYLDTKQEELYNHKLDHRELCNIASDNVEICKNFKQKLFEKYVECDVGIFDHYSLW